MGKLHLYIVITRTNTVLSKIIQWSKNDDYTHAAISLDIDLNSMYSFGRKYTYNPFVGKFKRETFDQGAYKFSKTLPGVIMEVEVTEQQYEKVRTLLKHFIANKEFYKYNYKGLLYGLFNKKSCRDDRFSCSEFVYYLLYEAGIVDFKISRNLVRPQNFLCIKGRILYKGDLKAIKFENYNRNTKAVDTKGLSVIYE